MAESRWSAEEFTIRKPLFRAGALVFFLGTLGGLYSDFNHGNLAAVALDVGTLGVLGVVVVAVRFWGLGRAPAVALLVYTGTTNFLLATVQGFLDQSAALETHIYNNAFVMALFLGVAAFLVGRSSSIVFGAMILGILLVAAFAWKSAWIANNLWFEVPAVVGACFLLYQYRAAIDRLLSDLGKAVGENKTLRDRERLAALGEMTAGIAHEIRNPLNFVVNFAESSQDLLTDLEGLLSRPQLTEAETEERLYLLRELRQNLEDIRTQGLRGASTIQGMLLQARNSTGEFQAVDLNELVGECLHLAGLAHRQIPVRQKFEPWDQPAVVRGSRGDLTRAFLNLCTNAFWSVLERRRREGPDYLPLVTVTVVVENEVRITVADNGLGFGPQTKAKLFVPFFTTKPVGEGTGLGLALTREVIVDQHGGRLVADGELGVGARFTVVLPLLGSDA